MNELHMILIIKSLDGKFVMQRNVVGFNCMFALYSNITRLPNFIYQIYFGYSI